MGDAELKGKDTGSKGESGIWEVITPGELYVEWPQGKAVVHMDAFFPAAVKEVRGLLEMIGMDVYNEKLTVQRMLDYLEDMAQRGREAAARAAGAYADCRQNYEYFRERAASKKRPNGVRLTEKELQAARDRRDTYKREASGWERDYKRASQRTERTVKNIELIRKLTGGGR